MLIGKFPVQGLLLLAALTASLSAQPVVVLTGAGGSGTTIPVFQTNPFQAQNTITNASPGAYQLLPKPDGTKTYVLANVGSTGVSVYDQNFTSGHAIGGNITLAPSAAGISPDGRRLIVLAGNVYMFDTATDTQVTTSAIFLSGNLKGVAFSVDSSKAFILSNSGSSGSITPIDLTTNAVGTALTLAGAGTAIATGPNGLLYVTTPNRLFEIDPRTLTVTPSGEMAVNALPLNLVLTPDGKYAVAINGTPITGSSLLLFDLTTHTLTGTFPNFNTILDRLVVGGSNRIFASSSANGGLYEAVIQSGFNLNPSPILSSIPNNVGSFAVSNEIPARTMYVTAAANGQNVLYKIDLTNNSVLGQVTIANASGQVVAYPALNPTSGATTLTAYNSAQIVQPGAISQALVARVQDSLGRPVFGARVDFTTTTAGAVLNPASAFTNSDGFAQTYVTAPTVPGPVPITAASAGTGGASFQVTVPGTTGGGGGGGSLASIKIVSGNGQIVQEQFLATQPMTVLVTDVNGNPASGVPVTFTITQGIGTILGGTSTTVTTDTTGQASSPFLATSIGASASYAQAIVTASSPVGNVNFIITTVISTLPNGFGAPPPIVILLAPDYATNPQRLLKGGAGQILPGAIQAQVIITAGVQAGQTIPNVLLNVGPNKNPDGTLAEDPTKVPTATCANLALTDSRGIASCDVLLGNVLGINSVNVNVGGLINAPQVLVQITVGPPGKIVKSLGDGQTGRTGQTLPQPMRIHVTDTANNSLQNVPLAWKVTQGTATLSAVTTQTDVNGNGSATITLGGTPGTVTIQVTAGTGSTAPTATFTQTIAVNIGGVSIVAGDGQTAVVNQQFPQLLTVLVKDDKGVALPGVGVTFAVTSGSASLANTAAITTDSSGKASVAVTAGSTAGPIQVTATAGNTNATFNLSSRLPGPPITTTSFTNAASGAVGLTPCGITIASAVGIAPGVQGVVSASNFFGGLPTSLAGVDLTVGGIPAPLFWVSANAVAFQTPCETQPGTTTVTMRVSGGSTTVNGVSVAMYQPGLFETTYNGRKYAVLLRPDGSYVSPTNPAHRGEQIKMFATGLGSVTPAARTGTAGFGGQQLDIPLTIGVNGGGVRLIGAEYLTGSVGVYVVTFEVPADTVTGDYQQLALVVNPLDGSSIYAQGSFFPIAP